MNTELLKKIEKTQTKDRPDFNVGDLVSVHNVIREGEKSRIQIYKGLVLAKRGAGLGSTFTVRKISDGIGVEKIFPLHSPNIDKIIVEKHGKVRRSKIYYMRDRTGRASMKVENASDTKLAKIAEIEKTKTEAIAAEKKAEEAKVATEAAAAEKAKADEAKVTADVEAAEKAKADAEVKTEVKAEETK